MLGKWTKDKDVNTDSFKKEPQKDISKHIGNINSDENTNERKVNNILKGSKVTGDISISCDLVLSGDVEGNIIALKDSNIVIKGSCKGNIETRKGDVDIRGELQSGNIPTEGNVSISGMQGPMRCVVGQVKKKRTIRSRTALYISASPFGEQV